MDLYDRFAGADAWHTRRLLTYAAELNDEQLDRPVAGGIALFGWEAPDQTLRQMLERMIFTTEIWTAALTGGPVPQESARSSPATMMQRFEKADAAFQGVLKDVRARGAWDDTFVDALCEPAETFTFGGMFAHVITFNTYRRLNALGALRQLGVDVQETGCAMDFEQAVAPWPKLAAG